MNENNGGAGLAIASMVLGIIALVSVCCTFASPFLLALTGILALLGVIFAGLSLYGQKPGKGMAIAGLVCSIIALIPVGLMIAFGVGISQILD